MGGITGRYPRVSRTMRKKMLRRFKIGDLVTWGRKVVANRVVEVLPEGLYVDASREDCRDAKHFVAWSQEPELADKKR